MRGLEPYQDESEGTVFRDVILLALAGFIAIVLLLIPHIAVPGAREADHAQPPGNILVEARWPDGSTADVDLWVQAPGDTPVGYSNRSGLIFDLLRDDLGSRGDLSDLNHEIAVGRGVRPGEHTVNLHLYRAAGAPLPIQVEVKVSVRPPEGGGTAVLLTRDVVLRREGEELTVARFALDAAGRLVPGSLHALHRPLRAARPPA